jgi:hypothetical protein
VTVPRGLFTQNITLGSGRRNVTAVMEERGESKGQRDVNEIYEMYEDAGETWRCPEKARLATPTPAKPVANRRYSRLQGQGSTKNCSLT